MGKSKSGIKRCKITCPQGHKAFIAGVNLPRPEANYRNEIMIFCDECNENYILESEDK